jgi:hypothetical protein
VSSIIALWAVSGVGSRSLRRRAMRLDLPEPVRPQIATFSPEFMVRWMLLRASLGALPF